MHYIHCLNNISSHGTDLLSDSYELVEDASKASGILVRSAAMHDMDISSDLLAIARAGAGVNNIPLDKCAEAGVVVFNTPGANANAVKEIVLCALLLGSRGIVEGIDWCKENANDKDIAKTVEKAKKAFAGREIKGKKLGVIGLGAIGAEVANAAIGLGMEVQGYDPFVSVGAAWRISSSVHHVKNLDDMFKTCDYFTIHVPATKDTLGLIGEKACALMKEGVVVVNFSRDTLVDNAALTAALEAGKVRTYITDFATPEVMSMPRTIVLPHLGASTGEAEENCAMMAVHEMMNYLDHGNIINSVNYPACDMGPCPETGGRIAVFHSNIPNMISQITSTMGNENVNIANLTNKARNDYSYTMFDIDETAPASAIEKLSALEGVRRVRVVK